MTEPTWEQTRNRLVSGLATIADLWDDMLDPASITTVGSTPSKEPPAPVSVHILDVRRDAEITLSGWCLVVIEDRELVKGPGRGGPNLAEFLRRHVDWMAEHEAAMDMLDEIEQHAAAVRRVARPSRREWMLLGSCPLIHSEDGQACGGQVRAYPEQEDSLPTCETCGTEADAKWWERAMFPDAETSRLVTAAELVLVVHREFGKVVKAATIRKWIQRQWIEGSGQDAEGRTLYDRGAVAYALTRRGFVSGRVNA